ncbi:MAG: SNF2-related protein, partial [bacterium]
MFQLTDHYISDQVADSRIIYQRGVRIFECGSFFCSEANPKTGRFVYDIDGTYGDYTAFVQFQDNGIEYACDCPYPGLGCKHMVAVLLDIQDQLDQFKPLAPPQSSRDDEPQEPYLSPQEIKELALEDRKKRAHQEKFHVTLGDMLKDVHLIETPKGKQYCITLHDPENSKGHCTCPDFFTNRLHTCKHLIHITDYVKKEKGYATKIMKERFPFVDIYWDSFYDKPRMFCERPASEITDIHSLLSVYFDGDGLFAREDLSEFVSLMSQVNGHKKVRIQEYVIKKVDDFLHNRQLEKLSNDPFPVLDMGSVQPYPYQMEGIRFSLYKRGALIGDEMGLGKTLQAIALGILKKEVFGFQKILVVTLASLKEQWKREIERFTHENAIIISGNAEKRRACYFRDDCLFKITNYEAVLRDVMTIAQFKPDLVILDEAQRIKNFNTKTADAMKCIPRKHSLVLTGTPLENKLEDVYSIVQFLDPSLLSPLWEFAADHFMLSRNKKGKVLGYRNLERLNERLQSIVIRRRKEEVLSDLPDEVVNNYFIDLADAQRKIHTGFLQSLLPLLNKKFLTPMDLKRIQDLLLCMRMVCDSTYLIDRKTHISPKLNELENIIDELVLQNGRKVVIFSEWTTMIFLIAKQLSRL